MMRIYLSILFILTSLTFAQDHLLITEIVVTPTDGEFIEIYNPTANTVDLSDYYLTDATFSGSNQYYHNIVTGSNAGGGSSNDFHARFPNGAVINAGEFKVIALNGTGFSTVYGTQPDYELYETIASIPNMTEAFSGSIATNSTLSNAGEVVIFYHWDGQSDLVQDIDYVVWGDKAEAVDKTGVSIDGPDPGSDPSTYLDDTSIQNQISVSGADPHSAGQSVQRTDLIENAEVQNGGNGITGHNETSEDLATSFHVGTPNPGSGPGGPTAPSISNVSHQPEIPTSSDIVTVFADVMDDGMVISVKLFYSIDSSPFDSTNMNLTSSDTYEATIAPQTDGTTVEYYIKATDDEGLASTTLTFSYIVGGPTITSIADIQANPSAYTSVTIQGTVTLGAGVTTTSWTDVFVQDSSNAGINIYGSGTVDPDLVRGNLVQITGTVEEYTATGYTVSITEIIDYTVTVISTGNSVSPPVQLTTQQANNTDLEGTFIEVSGEVKDRFDAGGGTTITIDDGSGECMIRVWNTTGVDLSNIAVGDDIRVNGPIDIYQDATQILLGYQEDLEELTPQTGDGSGTATIDPDSVGLSEIVSEVITIQGESQYTLANISVQVPNSWLWSGSGIDVRLSGSGFSSASVDVQNKLITISNAAVTDVNTGMVTVSQLTSPANSEQSVFTMKTAIDGGTLTTIVSSPTVHVGAGGPLITQIADIQANPSAYTTVTIQGTVTLGAGITTTGWTDVFVQDSSNAGINIYQPTTIDPDLVRGNLVQITGTVEEYTAIGYTVPITEIIDYTVTVISTGNSVSPPVQLTTQQANNTDLEGTFIEVTGEVIDRFDAGGGTTITIDDGSGECTVRAWNTTGVDLSNIAVGDGIRVNGPIDVYQDATQILLGYQEDLEELTPQTGDGSGTATIDPDSVGLSESVSESITIQGESQYTLATISLQVPNSWLWNGTGIDVQLSGIGFSGASVDVQNKLITISNAAVTDVNTGTVTIEQLTSPTNSEQSVFTVKTAIDGGTLTAISSSPRILVGAGGPATTPIADIQDNPSAYSTVTIEGIVTLGAGRTITTRTDAYVQDNSGRGINIFSFDPPDPLLMRGNRVQITGTVDEFNGVTEITNYSIQLISTGNDLPEPLFLSTNDANNVALEGTYIRVKGVATSIEDFGDAANVTVDDGGGEVLVRVWATTGINLGFLSTGDSVIVAAVMDIFSGAAQLAPGYQDEVAEPGTGSAADGSGSASTSATNFAVSDTVSEFSVTIVGTTQDTLHSMQIDVPIFWQWSGVASDLTISKSGFQSASSQIQSEDGIIKIKIENIQVTLADSGMVTFKNMRTPADSINSVFWIQTAGENGKLRFISGSPIVTVGGGNRYWMYDLQTNSGNFNGNVTVRGITTIGAGLLRVTSSGGSPLTTAYIQDESGRGLNLFQFGVLDTAIIKRDNYVEATGTVTEFSLVTEMEYTSLTLLGTAPRLTPRVLKNREANSAKWDGTLIQTDGVVIDKYSAGGGTTIVFSDGEGSTNVRVWDTANLDLSDIEVNKAIVVSGVGSVFISGNDTLYQILSVYDDQIELDLSYQPSLADVFLKTEPYPFVPDRGEKIGITYNVGAVNNQATIRIFDLGGRLILTLLSEPATIIQNRIEWDGRNELKDLVPLGTYICHLEVIEQATGEKKTAMAPIVVGTILKR
jgi:hypothetical protein